MTKKEAFAQLPVGAKLSCSFGNPGEGNYQEYWRDSDGTKWIISNGDSYLDRAPFNWTCTKGTK